MKKSIKSLPKCTQNELAVLQELILKHLSKVAMVILFGSYAKKKYVIWDEYVEDGIRYSYQSDLDILLIVETKYFKFANQKVRNKIIPTYNEIMEECSKHHAPARIIVETISFVNKNLKIRQYFFSEILKEGIMLYDNKLFELAKPKELIYREMYKISQDYYDTIFPYAKRFLVHAYSDFNDSEYVIGSFELHQACENFFNSIELVYTHYRTKSHKLEDLRQAMCRYSLELKSVFPETNEFEIHCFKLLCDAYIKARYNKHFRVTKEELEYLIQRVEILKDFTEQICKIHLQHLKGVSESEQTK